RRRARGDGPGLPRGPARAPALRGRARPAHRRPARPGLPARDRRRGLGAGPPRGHPRDPGRQRPRGGRLLRRPRHHRLPAGGPRGGDPGDRPRHRGPSRAHRRGRDGPAGAAAQPPRAGPGDPPHAGEPHAGQGHGSSRPQARGGPVLDGPEGAAHRGALRAAARARGTPVNARYRLLLRLLPYLRPYWPVLVLGGMLALLVSGAEALIAWLVKPAMDDIFLKRDVAMLRIIPLALLGAYLLKGAGRFGQSYLMASVGERVIASIRRELYAHIQSMPLSFFASLHSGDLMARVVTDVNRLARLSSTVLVMAVRHVGTIAALLTVMFLREWVLALIAIAVFPIVGIAVRVIGRKLYKINRRTQQKIAELNVVLQESFTGTKIVKAFGREGLEQERFNSVNDRLLGLALKDRRVDEMAEPLMEVLGALAIMGALWYGGYRVISGALTPGEFFSFTAAVVLLYGPVRQLSRMVNTVQQSIASVERVFEILDTPPAIVDAPGAYPVPAFTGAIEFEGAGFRYPEAEDWALQ